MRTNLPFCARPNSKVKEGAPQWPREDQRRNILTKAPEVLPWKTCGHHFAMRRLEQQRTCFWVQLRLHQCLTETTREGFEKRLWSVGVRSPCNATNVIGESEGEGTLCPPSLQGSGPSNINTKTWVKWHQNINFDIQMIRLPRKPPWGCRLNGRPKLGFLFSPFEVN